MIQVSLTKEGFRQLEEKLEYLKTVRRPEIAEELKEARSHGDLSENSEYDAAKNEQGLTYAKIQELEAAQVSRMKDEVAFVVLNGNYALEAPRGSAYRGKRPGKRGRRRHHGDNEMQKHRRNAHL